MREGARQVVDPPGHHIWTRGPGCFSRVKGQSSCPHARVVVKVKARGPGERRSGWVPACRGAGQVVTGYLGPRGHGGQGRQAPITQALDPTSPGERGGRVAGRPSPDRTQSNLFVSLGRPRNPADFHTAKAIESPWGHHRPASASAASPVSDGPALSCPVTRSPFFPSGSIGSRRGFFRPHRPGRPREASVTRHSREKSLRCPGTSA